MIFNSPAFAVFLPIVLIAYWLVPRRRQNIVLLVASYVFYGWWDWRFLSLLLLSTVIDFVVGRRYQTVADDKRIWLLRLSLVVNLGILATFKYFDFFVDSAADLLSQGGLGVNRPLLTVVLPVGISFYTFQTLSYSFDVYRRRIEPCRSLVDFGTYVAFFPQLVAGPIERAQNLLPQIMQPRGRPSTEQAISGVSLFMLGLFKKVAIADMMGPVVDRGFGADPSTLSSNEVLVALVAFSIQIYADFSGYTDMARGVSRLLNIELMHNFSQPYLSRNIAEFWQRWHISLSTWLRDYLYIPLGGNRHGVWRTYRNLMITMLLGGLWHGAGANFVVWGALHGLMLAAHRALSNARPAGAVGLLDIPRILWTYVGVTFAWLFFRADSFSSSIELLRRLSELDTNNVLSWDMVLVGGAALVTLAIDLARRSGLDRGLAAGTKPALAGALAGAAALMVIVSSGGQQTPFIYFQF